MSEDCQSCGTAMWDLDEEGLCPACSIQEIDLLGTCGKFDSKECISSNELCELLNLKGENEE